MKKILVPTSGVVSAYDSAEYAMQIAKAIGAVVHVLHIVTENEEADEFDSAIKVFELASEAYEVQVEGQVIAGNIVEEIIKYAEAENVNLVLMGASHGEVVDQWLSNEVLGRSSIPVLVMPFQVFETA